MTMESIPNPTDARIEKVSEALQQFAKLHNIGRASVEYRLPDGTLYTTTLCKVSNGVWGID